MTKLFTYIKPHRFALFGLFLLMFVQVLSDLQLPVYMATIINQGIVGKQNDLIITNGTWMLLLSLLGAFCTIGVGFLSSLIATSFAMDLREKVFSRVERFSMREFDEFSTSSLLTRSTNDIQQIQMVLMMLLRMVLSAPIMAIGAIIKAYSMAPSMSWIIALAVTVLVGVISIIFSIALPRFKILQKLVDKLNLVTRENLTGLRIIRAFTTEEYEQTKFDKVNITLTDVNLFVNRLMLIMHPFMILTLNLTSVGIVWIGSYVIGNGNLAIGDMIAFMQYAMQVITSFLMLSFVFIMIPRASVSADRVAEVLATEPDIVDPKDPRKFSSDIQGEVEFQDVTFFFSHADEPVLKNISFTAKAGQTTAFIGSTGSGKSTLVNLIPRFYDVTAGRILIDGIDIREVSHKDLCEKIGYVPQKGVLFAGSIASNIAYGVPEASDVAMHKAAQIAQVDDFIMEFPETYQAPITQGGSNVSGGQKQRLSIARAIIKNPEIYIFDDSFSALDFKTDALLRKALHEETKEATVLIVAQRIGTIMEADNIIVLNEGQIVGTGTHEELLATNLVYREIASSQLSDEELSKCVSAVSVKGGK